jgi:hypothetical protein
MNKRILDILAAICIYSVVSSLVVFLLGGYSYFIYGKWRLYRFIVFTPDIMKEWLFSKNDWVGLKTVIFWLLQCPFCLFLLMLGIFALISHDVIDGISKKKIQGL